jgi:phage regulator Rha-like protein
MLKQMKLDDRKLSIAEMKKAQLIFTSETGKGSRGQFLTLLLVKLWELLKKTLTRAGREAIRAEKRKRADEKERERTGLDENEL